MQYESSALLYVALLVGGILFLSRWAKERKLNAITPAIGPWMPILSCWGALKFLFRAQAILEEGYVEYGGRPYRIAMLYEWHYIVSSPEAIDELQRAPEDVLSFMAVAEENLQLAETLGSAVTTNTYHIPVLRTTLTRNLRKLHEDIYDEICNSIAHCIPATDDWTPVVALDALLQIVARTSGRIILGLPFCRNTELLDIMINFTTDVVTSGLVFSFTPSPLKPLVKPFITKVDKMIDRALAMLRPTIEQRQNMMEKQKHGEEWADKPNDILQWLMDAAEGEEREPRALTVRFLLVCFASIHTTSMTLTQALYRLAANPEYIAPLREEVESVLDQDGLSKATMEKLRKVDSFFKETQRIDGLGCLLLTRKALRDYTLADGTRVPAGCYVSTTPSATHRARACYDAPHAFDPWRFARMREEPAQSGRHQIVTPSAEHLAFGLGHHSCPGRYFAAVELKTIMAHLVMKYDFRLENLKLGEIPPPMHISNIVVPNRTAKVLFRKRKD
ncbi:cytochrome P450 [Phanerochaete sordida]|uniref:Cytochrome P450 n=1 Tax=Phanerochaete sordida TaxID=48140 RepID=A0A9P3GBH0_9APHY|nr:cytochrome P450 [Phanerochaete sordida]